MKKLLSIILLLAMITTLLAACGGSGDSSSSSAEGGSSSSSEADGGDGAETVDLKVAFVIDSNFGSQSFNDVILAGAERAEADFGIELVTAEGIQAADAADTYTALIAQGVNMFIVGSGANMDAVMPVALENPDVLFASVDYTPEEVPENVVGVAYREQEAAFLNAAFAMLMSKDQKIAWFGGAQGGTMVRFEAGFLAGAQYINPEGEASVTYVGFSDVNKAKETATLLYDQGFDWILSTAAASNLGTFQASQEKGGEYWVCGAADGQFHLMPDRIVASQVKKVDNVTYSIIEQAVNGEFPGGESTIMGVAEDGVDLLYNEDNAELMAMIPDDVKATIEDIRAEIADGTIVVPGTAEEVEAFTQTLE